MFNFCITFAHCDRNDFTKSCSFFSQMAMHEVAVYGTWDLTRMLYILSFFGGTMKNLLSAYRVFCEEKHVLRRRNNQVSPASQKIHLQEETPLSIYPRTSASFTIPLVCSVSRRSQGRYFWGWGQKSRSCDLMDLSLDGGGCYDVILTSTM